MIAAMTIKIITEHNFSAMPLTGFMMFSCPPPDRCAGGNKGQRHGRHAISAKLRLNWEARRRELATFGASRAVLPQV
jgi:hypothetical protein